MLRTRKISVILFFTFLASFMDSYPILPSNYKPLAFFILLPFSLLGFMYNIIRKKNRENVQLLLYFLIGLLVSVVYGIFIYKSIEGIIDYSVGIVFMYICYLGFIGLFTKYKVDLQTALPVLEKVGIILIVIGFVEILSIFHIFPYVIKQVLNYLLTSKSYERFLLVNNEPSWASTTLLFFTSIFISKKRWTLALVAIFLILASFSLQGWLLLLIYFCLLLIYKYGIKAIFTSTIIFFLLYTVTINLLPVLLTVLGYEDNYMGSRLLKWLEIVRENNSSLWNIINKIILVDGGSTYVRVMYPVVGFIEGVKRVFGLGGSGFGLALPEMIREYNLDTSIPLVAENYHGVFTNINNMYSRSVLENGIWGFFIFLMILKNYYIRFKTFNMVPVFLFFITIFFQFAWYNYIPMILIISLFELEKDKIFYEDSISDQRKQILQ